ncbi:MAG: hypothetical protein HRU15_01820, partial [Planctomycetes bacterium]|nr:hypothetical protein [Planctomycetota bacterium]
GKEATRLLNDAAAKHGLASIDLFAMCETEHAADNSLIFGEMYKADNARIMVSPAGIKMIAREIKKVMGVVPKP